MSTQLANRRIAAIDVGSNSTHLVVAEVDELGHIHILESMKEQTLLGASIDPSGCLNAEALIRLTRTLKRMNEICASYGALVRAVGTHSLRQAKNGREFCQKVLRRCGVNIEIVTGQEEARLIYLGVQLGLEIRSRDVLLMDIGGGSTEILVGERGEEHYSTSLKLGCVRLTADIFAGDEYTNPEIKKLQKTVSLKLKSISHDIKKVGYDLAVCSSGTVKAVKMLALGLAKKPVPETLHGLELSLEEIDLAHVALQHATTPKLRRALPHVEEQRADILLAGCTILREFSIQHDVKKWTLSLFALREGILVDLVSRDGEWLQGDPADIRWRSIRAFGKKLHIDELHAHRTATLSLRIFDLLKPVYNCPELWREYLRCASYLHEGGRFLSFSSYHKHSYYLIRSASLLGFTLSEQEFIALIARFHRKRLPKVKEDLFANMSSDDLQRVKFCSSVLRLAVALDKSRSGRAKDFLCEFKDEVIELTVVLSANDDFDLELFAFEAEKQNLQSAFGRPIKLQVV